MANFTEQQAGNCMIIAMAEKCIDGVHYSFLFGVKDEDGNEIRWEDTEVSSTASKNVIKAKMKEYLLRQVKKLAPKVIVRTKINDKGLGETVV